MTINWTDATIATLLVLSAVRGAKVGFLRSLIGPGTILLATAAAFALLALSRNLGLAFLVGVLGPIPLAWAAGRALRPKSDEDRAPMTMASAVAGAGINFLWNGALLALTLFFLTLLPLKDFGLASAARDLEASASVRLIADLMTHNGRSRLSPVADCPTGSCAMSDTDAQTLSQDTEIEALLTDERIQALLKDPAIQAAVEKKDFAALLANPGIQALTQDPTFIMKALKAYPKIRARMRE